MKIILFFCSTLLISAGSFTQNVNIPDANFKNALLLNSSINTNSDTEISFAEAAAYNGILNVDTKNISDLTGIEAFISITELSCISNNLTLLDVSNNTSLIKLFADDNQLTNVNVSNRPNLQRLALALNQLTSLDVTNNPQLTHLTISNNTLLTSINLNNNSNLVVLDISVTSVASIDSVDLSNKPSLSMLFLRYTLIDSINISTNQNISMLWTDNNPNLTYLNLKNGNNTAIILLDASNNPNLTCIEVDNVAWSNTNWTDKDATAFYSTSCTVGIDENNNNHTFSIYPNPTNGYVTIQLEEIPKNVVINIKDILGKTLLEQKVNSNKTLINLSSLPKGIYQLSLKNEVFFATKKIVVQ